jgi:transcriptional regulator with XRE-family HTH domain
LRLERQRAELKQSELAARLKWDQSSISDIETGEKRVTVLELMSIAEELGFDPSEALKALSKVPDK